MLERVECEHTHETKKDNDGTDYVPQLAPTQSQRVDSLGV